MSQNPVDNVPALNTGDDLGRSTAMTANLDIGIEYSFESLGPGYRSGDNRHIECLDQGRAKGT
tara:strand:+ start:137 stop:325 length:189 start_codon:yes stop_codon:yes gene_type:complete